MSDEPLFFCNVTLLQSLERQGTGYLNILMLMLDIFQRNILYQWDFSVDYQDDYFGYLLLILSEMLWLPIRTDQAQLPLRFLCLYSSIIYVFQEVAKHVENIFHFIVIKTICLNLRILKFCWKNFHKSFNEVLNNFIISTYIHIHIFKALKGI